jgi:CubicO group peptidase (beta-lactamase class C family)
MPSTSSTPSTPSTSSHKANMLRPLIASAIADGAFPGACWAVGNPDGSQVEFAGRFTYCPDSPAVAEDTVWDLASVSKVVGTTSAAMLLFDDGKLKLDAPVADLIPEFGRHGKERITLRNLMVHDSGLIAFRPYHRSCKEPGEVLPAICEERLQSPVGAKTVYSDLNMILLHECIERLAGEPMPELLRRRVFEPLGMRDTGYKPGLGNPRCAPTEAVEEWRLELRRRRGAKPVEGPRHPDLDAYIQGEVHDPNAAVLGGVAGHAGLFSTAGDLAKYMSDLLTGGGDIFRRATIERFTRRQDPKSSRALGWDTPSANSSAGTKFSPRSFGHTGYTGTSVWADPERGLFAVLLTNRVHPTADNPKIVPFRRRFHDAVAHAFDAR